MKTFQREASAPFMAPLYVTVGVLLMAGVTFVVGAFSHERALVAVSIVGAVLAGLALAWYRRTNSSFLPGKSAPHTPVFVQEDRKAGAGERIEQREPQPAFPIEDYDRLSAEEILPLLWELDDVGLSMVKSREKSQRRRWFILKRIEAILAGEQVRPVESPFPIPGYDQMRVVDVLPLLKSLTPEELDVVAHHELESAGRRTVLTRIARIQERHRRLPTGYPDSPNP